MDRLSDKNAISRYRKLHIDQFRSFLLFGWLPLLFFFRKSTKKMWEQKCFLLDPEWKKEICQEGKINQTKTEILKNKSMERKEMKRQRLHTWTDDFFSLDCIFNHLIWLHWLGRKHIQSLSEIIISPEIKRGKRKLKLKFTS